MPLKPVYCSEDLYKNVVARNGFIGHYKLSANNGKQSTICTVIPRDCLDRYSKYPYLNQEKINTLTLNCVDMKSIIPITISEYTGKLICNYDDFKKEFNILESDYIQLMYTEYAVLEETNPKEGD